MFKIVGSTTWNIEGIAGYLLISSRIESCGSVCQAREAEEAKVKAKAKPTWTHQGTKSGKMCHTASWCIKRYQDVFAKFDKPVNKMFQRRGFDHWGIFLWVSWCRLRRRPSWDNGRKSWQLICESHCRCTSHRCSVTRLRFRLQMDQKQKQWEQARNGEKNVQRKDPAAVCLRTLNWRTIGPQNYFVNVG